MLDKDESLISYRHNPKTGLIGTLKNAFTGLGHLNTPVFQHYSRKYRKRNPVYIEITEIIKPGEWIAVTPSIQVDKDTSLTMRLPLLKIHLQQHQVFLERQMLYTSIANN